MLVWLGCTCAASDDSISPTPIGISGVSEIEMTNSVADEFFATRSTDGALIENDIPDKSKWDYDTMLHALFQNDLFAGNVDFTVNSFNMLRIKRREKGTYTWLTLYEKPIKTNLDFSCTYEDYYARNAIEYEYALVPLSANGTEGSYIISSIVSDFNGVWIAEKDLSVHAMYNLEFGTNIYNNTRVIRAGGEKYPHVYQFGESGAVDGNITTTFYPEINGCMTLDNAVEYRRNVIDPFLTNGNPKIIKHWDGRIWLAVITDNIDISEDYWKMPLYSFSFQSIGDPNDQSDLYDSNLIDIQGR
ncbi:MAG: hypothetical protein Q4P84_00315 [Elusimicrobiales bacterium]|nr:hypothetical protein [Elusimicrobiales bacterium]